jgi:hypothetical protein
MSVQISITLTHFRFSSSVIDSPSYGNIKKSESVAVKSLVGEKQQLNGDPFQIGPQQILFRKIPLLHRRFAVSLAIFSNRVQC